jgi:MFS family permease
MTINGINDVRWTRLLTRRMVDGVTTVLLPSRPVEATPSTARHAAGSWIIGAVFLIQMAFASLPTPLYPLYQQRDGFAAFTITVIFAVYAVGVMASLIFLGHLSDWLGRRRMVAVSVVVAIVADLIFLISAAVPALIVARFVDGVAIGALTAAATTHYGELRATARPHEPRHRHGTVAGAINIGGLAIGPLVGGVLAQYVAHPLVVPYAVFGVLLVAGLAALVFVPETVDVRRRPYRPQRVSVPGGTAAQFVAAGVGGAAGFAVLGLVNALGPGFMAGTLHEHSHLAAGAMVFGVMGASALSQLGLAGLVQRRQLQLGAALMTAGLAGLIGVGAGGTWLWLFVASAVLAGAGVGLMFRTAIVVAASLAGPDNRGEVLAGMFLFVYGGITVPVVAIGVVLEFLPITDALMLFAAVVLACVLGATALTLRRLR